MRISFDIDDTLVCTSGSVPSEPCWFTRLAGGEKLRLGARALLCQLRRRGCDVWIYTSSFRSPLVVRLWLLAHGIRVDGIVNGDRHRQLVRGGLFASVPSKYPPAFAIDLHVDDAEGVRIEGERHGFRVVVVAPDDECWTQKVLDAIFPQDPLRQ